MDKISIIVPIYNTQNYLQKCLDSLVNQTYKNIEIILVDDGSTDDSYKICESYKGKYENIVIIHKENGGASDARNEGLRNAKGDYIHFIDSDDFLIKDNLYSDVLKIIDTYKPNIIFSLYKGYDKNNYSEIESQPLYNSNGFYEGNVLLDVLKNGYIMTLTCPVNKLFNRRFLLDNNLFFTVGLDHEEDEWLPRVIACAKNCYFFNEYIYGVRCFREGALSQTKSEQVMARKARSKMKIAKTGAEFMKNKLADDLTLKYSVAYYWRYMISAVIATQKLRDKKLRKENFKYIKSNKEFFNNYKLLLNKNWRIMGLMFKFLGIKFTAKFVGKRYES